MPDREKVIRGLQCIVDGTVRCESCGYAIDKHGHYSCQQNCASDAIALLKEQDKEIKQLRTWKAVERGEVIRTYEDRNEAKLE